MFWKTNYLEGAELITGEQMVQALYDTYGQNIPAPNGALFSQSHLLASVGDLKYWMLRKDLQEKFVDKYEKTTDWYKWTANVGDCDSQTIMFGGNINEGAIKKRLVYGIALWDLWYVSESRRSKDADAFWNGYHSAPSLPYRTTEGVILYRVRQVTSLNYKGRWQGREEVRHWVGGTGLT